MIKILIAEDSATEAALLKHLFEQEKDMQVIGCARNGKEAVELAAKLKPDLITMDIQMPIMDGFEATQLILMENPVPIVVISSTLTNKNLNTTFLALEAGAIGVMDKPVNALDPNFKYARKRMIDFIRAMSEIQVVRKRFLSKLTQNPPLPLNPMFKRAEYEIVAIGASVGGPQALKTILSQLSPDFPLPIVIVQHITVGFIEGFCQWLSDISPLIVKCAEQHEILNPGTIYFAPENYHLKINRAGKNLVAFLQTSEPVAGFYPSINVLFQSIAKTCGKNAIGVLLTGMGRDGAQGLLELKNKQAHTIIQDKKSSVVFGMAGVAEALGAVDQVVELDRIANYLKKIT